MSSVKMPSGEGRHGYGRRGGGAFQRGHAFGTASSNGAFIWTDDYLRRKPFRKDFLEPCGQYRRRSGHEVDAFKRQMEISLLRGEAPEPCIHFNDLRLPSFASSFLRASGFIGPTPVQAQGWTVALKGLNMVAIAATGSGKTLAYLLPGAIHAEGQDRSDQGEAKGPMVLVLAPTRELAQQIEAVSSELARGGRMRSVCLSGGTSKGPQISALERGCQMAVATPGRMNDLIEMRKVRMRTVWQPGFVFIVFPC